MDDADGMVQLGLDLSPADASAPRTRFANTARHGVVLVVFVLVGALATFAVGPGHVLAPLMHPGLPAPANATSVVPSDAPKLLIRMDVPWDKQHLADYLSDGTVIRWTSPSAACRRGGSCGTLERNTLTASGLASLRALLLKDADLLGKPRIAATRVMPDGRVNGYVDNVLVLQRPDGSRYTVTFPDAQPEVVRTDDNDAYFEDLKALAASDPTIDRLNALAEVLADPVTLVGVDGLVDTSWKAYKPASLAVFVTIYHQPERDPTNLAPNTTPPDLNAWPFEGDPETFGGAFDDASVLVHDQVNSRCALLPSGDVESAIADLTGPKGRAQWADSVASGTRWERRWRWTAKSPTRGVSMMVVGLLPEDSVVSCLDALSY